MRPYLSGDTYCTPNTRKRALGDRLALGTRLYFAVRYLLGLFRYCRMVKAGKYDTGAWVDSSIDILKLLESCGGRFCIEGMDHIVEFKGPAVFIANHMSTLETQILPMLIQPHKPVTFVVKQSLLKMPFFGSILNTRTPIAVNRDHPREDLKTVLEEGQKRLAEGLSIIIFPQSTRSRELKLESFNSLGIKLARKAGVPVIPVALKTDFWGNGRFFLKDIGPLRRKLPIHFCFGKPLHVESAGKQQQDEVFGFISSKLASWQ